MADETLPHVVRESEVEWFVGLRIRVLHLSDGRRIIPVEELEKLVAHGLLLPEAPEPAP